MTDPALLRFRALLEAGLAALEERRQEVNDLNVFPVADGDTGDNMALTLQAVLAELDRLAGECGGTLDEIGRDEIVTLVARAALLGARGNSGVILSQIIRGAAQELISRPGELIDPVLIGAAFARGADQAYDSVREPTEGTILTVVRAMASQVASELAHMPEAETRLGHGVSDDRQDALAALVLGKALNAGEASVKRGPELLPVLRDAGVVDSGAYGLTLIVAGMVSALRGERTVELEHHVAARITHPEHSSTTFRYCTNFVVTGSGLDGPSFADELERIGDSMLVVGDEHTLKVHVHTDDPEAAQSVFTPHGTVSRLEIADMSEQVRQRDSRLGSQIVAGGDGERVHCGVVAVSTGAGFQNLFAELGVTVLDGGPTLNPSTRDLLAAIHATNADEVVVLPNSSNVFMAAEHAAQLSERPVRIVHSRSLQAGLAAAFIVDRQRDAAENHAAMEELVGETRTGAVAPAARDDAQGRFHVGDALGFVDDQLVVWGDSQRTLADVIARLATDAELVTCLRGAQAPLDDEAVRSLADGAELELADGGQEHYWWLLSAE